MEETGLENVFKRLFRTSNEMLLKKLESRLVQKSKGQSFG